MADTTIEQLRATLLGAEQDLDHVANEIVEGSGPPGEGSSLETRGA